MSLNEQIREHRKKAGLTQEQLARYLGVSTPAVNKWESGATYPDITLLAPLARLLSMDMNTLFAFHEVLPREEIGRFCNRVEEIIHAEGFSAGFTAATAKLREYPNCDLLRYSMASFLEADLAFASLEAEDRANYERQIMEWYEQASNSGDEETREAAISVLANKHLASGKIEEAEKLIDRLSDKKTGNRQMLKINLLLKQKRYEEAAVLTEMMLFGDMTAVQGYLMKLVEIELQLGNTDAAIEAGELSRKLTELFGFWEYNGYVCLLQTAIALRDTEKSLVLMEAMLNAAEKPVQMPAVFRHLPTKPVEEDFAARVVDLMLHQFETDDDCRFLQCNANFQSLVTRYRAKYPAKKHGPPSSDEAE